MVTRGNRLTYNAWGVLVRCVRGELAHSNERKKENAMQNTDVFDEFSQEEKSEKQFRDEGLVNFPQTVPPVELLPD